MGRHISPGAWNSLSGGPSQGLLWRVSSQALWSSAELSSFPKSPELTQRSLGAPSVVPLISSPGSQSSGGKETVY